MRKIAYIILIPIVLLTVSCKDFLDEKPASQIQAAEFWKTEADIKGGLAGMYDGLQNSLKYYISYGDGRSDNLIKFSSSDAVAPLYTNNALNPTIPDVSWSGFYTTIGRANDAIAGIKKVPNLSKAVQNNYLAQAYAMRAYCYFWAVRIWGDVPVSLEPLKDRNTQLFQTPAGEVIDNVIIADLDSAYKLVNPTNTDVHQLNVGAILAIQMEVYMWKKDYQKALAASDKLIALNQYGLAVAADWRKIFTDPGSTKENIWSLYWSLGEDGTNNLAKQIGNSNYQSQFKIDSLVVVRFESNKKDIRRFNTYDTTKVTYKSGKISSVKNLQKIWKYYPATTDKSKQYPARDQAEAKNVLYRWADILLLRAEAYNQLGNKIEAVKLLNQVRTRAGIPTLNVINFTTTEAVEKAILDERQLELFAEAKRWFDLVRTNQVSAVMDPILEDRKGSLFGQDTQKFLFPIGVDVLNANQNIEQNQAYKSF